ncbi:MAG: helix-hairpin-helix domain-containing protein, partial [Bacteroidota bacterium]
RHRTHNSSSDPTTVSATDLQRLGLSTKQAASWIKFRGQRPRAFRTAEDIRKLFILSDKDKDRLVALAVVPEQAHESEEEAPAVQTFYFDPNTISADSLQLLGFPKWQAQALLRYRGNRSNTFRRATDLRRVGALDSARVEYLLSWVKLAPIPSTTPAHSASSVTTVAPDATTITTYASRPKAPLPPPASVDINTADTTLWKSLPGIGSYRAKRILRFRAALGGFISVDQIAKTHGLPDSTFRAIIPYLRFATPPQQLPINQASYEDLKRHPYINRNLANLIVKNREKAGPFRGPEDLKRLRLITEEKYKELVPYFSFE